ncbi:MAG: hypothetical protein CME70_09685 [Halobacteriovorax sp.]|nr:hypothetical protein [Halobacteriovorax sp.]|tara:strand:+ start:131283 stop:131741 length:459 start_codon:yes stop_codon:yes gene_type:complete
MSELSESKFNMWRAAFSIIHVDGKVSIEEQAWAKEKLSSLPLSNSQKSTLELDLVKGAKVEELLPSITHKPDRAFLLHLCRTIGHLEGDYSDSEKEAFKYLEKEILKDIDLAPIEAEVQKMEELSNKNKLEIDNKHSILENVIERLLFTIGL